MLQITDLLNQSQIELRKEIDLSKSRRVCIDPSLVPEESFRIILKIECDKVLAGRNKPPSWEIDKFNESMISSLYLFLIASPEFNGDFTKGIMLAGKIGCGKTVLLKGFCGVIEKLSNKVISKYHAMGLAALIKKEGVDSLLKKIIFIDDLGKEDEIMKDYGTDIRPIQELFSLRYDIGSWTFATTNYKEKTLKEKYGEQTTERFKEIFNLFELPGESRRK